MLQGAHPEGLYDAGNADREKLFAGLCQTRSNVSFPLAFCHHGDVLHMTMRQGVKHAHHGLNFTVFDND